MKSNSVTVTLASVAKDIDQGHNGSIDKDDLLSLLGEHGVHQEAVSYVSKMLDRGYLYRDHIEDLYRLTDAGSQTVTISITVPRLLSKEARRHIVAMLVAYGDIIEVSEVEI